MGCSPANIAWKPISTVKWVMGLRIRWQGRRLEWKRVKSSGGLPIFGSAPVVPWFISVATPKALGRRFKCVRALRVQEDELELQTHTIPRLSLCTSPSHWPPAPTLLCKTTPALPYSINLYTFQHSSSFPPDIYPSFLRYGCCTLEWLAGTLGIVAGGGGRWVWWMPRLSRITALTQMCQTLMLKSVKFSWTRQSFLLASRTCEGVLKVRSCVFLLIGYMARAAVMLFEILEMQVLAVTVYIFFLLWKSYLFIHK